MFFSVLTALDEDFGPPSHNVVRTSERLIIGLELGTNVYLFDPTSWLGTLENLVHGLS
jgi:hypothetical protein